MRTIASRILDARNTIEGKIISVILSVMLVAVCFNVAIFTNEANAAGEEGSGETTTTEVEGTTEGAGNVSTTPDTSGNTTGTTPEPGNTETSGTEAPGQDEGTGNGGEEGDDEGNPNGTPEGGDEGTGGEGDGEEEEQEEPAAPIVFDEETGTLTITGVETVTAADVVAYKAIAKKVIINNVGTIAGNGTDGAFRDFKMESLEISDVDHIGYAFLSCTNLKTLTVQNVGTIDANAFYNPAKLQTLYMDNIGSMGANVFCVLNGATALTSATLKNMNIGNRMLAEHKNLSSLTLENIGTIEFQAFMNCTSLTSVALTGNVVALGGSAFYGCTGLTELNLDGVEVGGTAFSGCSGLETATIKNVGNIGNQVFAGCTNLKTVTIENATGVGQKMFASYATEGTAGYQPACGALHTITLNNVESIGQYAFGYSPALTTVNMTSIGSIGRWAFFNCPNLRNINTLRNVKNNIDGFAFLYCPKLDVNAFDVDVLTKMGYIGSNDAILARVKEILAGRFKLKDAENIDALMPEEGWSATSLGQSENWDKYDNGTQLMQQARWIDSNEGLAEVKIDAYYTGEKQMDYVFVADLSASMAQLGNSEDNNARFYDMQSKLFDTTNKLLSTPGYDCRVAIVSFGGINGDKATCSSSEFLDNAKAAEDWIAAMEPLNENTDYGLGMQKALELVKSNADRKTAVVFLSDGAPYVPAGKEATSGDLYGISAATAIQELKVPIFGVLHSPGAAHDKALAAMEDVCGKGNVSEAFNTDTFGRAMNAAFAAVYGSNTVTIPVNAGDFDVEITEVSAGEATYANGVITWTIKDMPFAQHTLNYRLILKDERANPAGTTRSYSINSGDAFFENNGAKTGIELQLSRTVAPTPGLGTGDPVVPPTQPTTPAPVGTVTLGTGAGAAAGAAAAAPAAAPVEDITDDATPMAQNPEGEGDEGEGEEEIIDDENPLGTFDVKHCTSHWFMLFGILLTAAYGIAVVRRRTVFANDLDDFEKSITGQTAKQRGTVTVPSSSHQAI